MCAWQPAQGSQSARVIGMFATRDGISACAARGGQSVEGVWAAQRQHWRIGSSVT
jgi:hypothetical protein